MMHPLGHKYPIYSGFGKRAAPYDPNTGKKGSSDHKGVDITVKSGSAVYAPLDGTVLFSQDTTPNPCGGFIQLDHVSVQTKFCHLRSMIVKQGDKVKKGQVIGYSGGGRNDPHPGVSTGPHLHYEILNKSGVAQNPLSVQPSLG
jgi:murein DD-endopeptidase MepM/ murein hydrolase activator NlpD